LRYIKDSACIETDSCTAFRADDVRFVSLNDAFVVTEEQLKSWGFNAKVNRQLRIVLDAEKNFSPAGLFEIQTRPDSRLYCRTKRLEPHGEAEEAEEPEEFVENTSDAEETKADIIVE